MKKSWIFLLLLTGCTGNDRQAESMSRPKADTTEVSDKSVTEHDIPLPLSHLDSVFIASGLVSVITMDSTLLVDLKYSSEDNFLKTDLYGDLENCYLQPDVAQKLARAQKHLGELKPGYSLILFDGARPVSIQRKMWDALDVPETERWKYVSNPDSGSLHNYGAAVDVSIADENGELLDMGTEYDYFGEEAQPELEGKMLAEKKLTAHQVENRKLLRSIMKKAGFRVLPSEWWHFNSCSREEARKKYRVVE